MFWIAIATQLASALPTNERGWFSHDDFPIYIVAAGETKVVKIRAVVRPDGSLQGCGIEQTSGDAKLDQWTCVLVAKRAHYTPARWTDGSIVFGVHRMPVTWAVGDPPPEGSSLGDVEVTVNQLPPDVRSPATVAVSFAADAEGKPLNCAEASPKLVPGLKSNPTLVSLACEQLISTFRALPPQDDAGRHVRSVQNAIVRFRLGK